MVVGFGAETASGAAVGVLERDGRRRGSSPAGARPTPTAARAIACVSGACGRRFFQAANAAELGEALKAITRSIDPRYACTIPLLSPPSEKGFLAVLVDSEPVVAGPLTWTYSGGAVVFAAEGESARESPGRAAQHPVEVEIRVMEPL